MDENDAQLQLKKRARRRLVGAAALAGLAAVVLPMVMDQEPRQAAQDVEVRIPGQDDKPFVPKFAAAPAAKASGVTASAVPATPTPALEAKPAETRPPEPEKPVPAARPAEPAKSASAEKSAVKAPERTPEKPVDKTPAKQAEKPVAEKQPVAKPVEKAPEKAARQDAESARAAAILAGKSPDSVAAPASSGQHVVLIGAFTNQANVRNLQNKLNELGIKSYTEPLDTPQGRKTRVRAGPFASREAADKALDKMRRIGVAGVLTARQ